MLEALNYDLGGEITSVSYTNDLLYLGEVLEINVVDGAVG